MDHHVDLDLRPDPEMAAHHVMDALYAKLHRALVRLGAGNIGVSFPDFSANAPSLGRRMRLHGTAHALTRLMDDEWLAGVRDHVDAGAVRPVPPDAKHRPVRRVQAKSNPARRRRRLMRRHDIDEQSARTRIPDEAVELLRMPFARLGSLSTGQSFRLFIAHEPLQQAVVPGVFNAYGLSQTATIPWF